MTKIGDLTILAWDNPDTPRGLNPPFLVPHLRRLAVQLQPELGGSGLNRIGWYHGRVDAFCPTHGTD